MEPVKPVTVEENFKRVVEQAKKTNPTEDKIRNFMDPWMAENWPLKHFDKSCDVSKK